MKYKGYSGHVEYDDEAKIFHGEVLGIKADRWTLIVESSEKDLQIQL